MLAVLNLTWVFLANRPFPLFLKVRRKNRLIIGRIPFSGDMEMSEYTLSCIQHLSTFLCCNIPLDGNLDHQLHKERKKGMGPHHNTMSYDREKVWQDSRAVGSKYVLQNRQPQTWIDYHFGKFR